MNEIEIRPTVKFVRAGAIAIGLIVLAGWTAFVFEKLPSIWIAAALTLLLFWPLERWLRTRATVTYLEADRIRSESGILSRSSRSLMLSRVQDVGVNQSFGQRIFDVGDIWIETAGAAGRIFLHNIDAPRELAGHILERMNNSRA